MLTSLLSLLSVAVVISNGLAAHAPLDMRRASHHALAKRASSELDIRQFSGAGTRFTFYYPHTGPGHCGTVHQDDEYIVAMNTAQFANGKHCYQPITLHYKGRSVTAKITDSCPYEYCPYGAVDLSPAAFAALSGLPRDQILNLGEMWGGSWEFGNGGGPSPEEIAAQKAKEKAAREKAEKAARAKAEKEAAEAAAREQAEKERKQKEKEEKARAKAEAEAAASSSAAAAAASSSAAEAARASASAASLEAAKTTQTTSANASELTPAPATPAANPQFLSTISNAYAGLGAFVAVVAASK